MSVLFRPLERRPDGGRGCHVPRPPGRDARTDPAREAGAETGTRPPAPELARFWLMGPGAGSVRWVTQQRPTLQKCPVTTGCSDKQRGGQRVASSHTAPKGGFS